MRFANIVWNLIGLGVPVLIAVFTIPELITLIGSERFGLLALAWGMIGYAGALDMGIGRAATQRISAMRNGEENHHIPHVVATAVRITSIAGVVGMLVILIGAMSGAYRVIQAHQVSDIEIQLSMMLLALALPLQAISTTYRGVNEAYLNFKGINILRMLLGAANFGAPYLVALYSHELHWLVATLVLSRGLALLYYRRLAHHCLTEAGHGEKGVYTKRFARGLFGFGGWLTVSNIAGPILVHADRFFVGALISATAVTLYVLPFEVVVQTLMLVSAITTIAFPIITNLIHTDPQLSMSTFYHWLFRIAGVMLAMMLLLAWIMPSLLRVWVGEHVSADSIAVGQILCIGAFFNSIGAMYYSLLHAHGHTKLTAYLHLTELPLYIGLLLMLIGSEGIVGCAVAWTVRAGVDTVALIWFSKRFEKRDGWGNYAVV